MPLKTLKPRLATLGDRLKPMSASSRQHGSAGIRWSGRKLQEWRARILKGEPLCRHCREKGITTRAQEVDHIVPLEQGGTYDDSNAQPLCIPCHQAKTAKDRGYRVRPQISADGWPVG